MSGGDSHGIEVHVDPGVSLNELLELLQTWHKLFGILSSFFNLPSQPSTLDAVVGWEPGTRTRDMMLVGDVVVISVLMNHCEDLLVAQARE